MRHKPITTGLRSISPIRGRGREDGSRRRSLSLFGRFYPLQALRTNNDGALKHFLIPANIRYKGRSLRAKTHFSPMFTGVVTGNGCAKSSFSEGGKTPKRYTLHINNDRASEHFSLAGKRDCNGCLQLQKSALNQCLQGLQRL
jgi:hypothetical protein